MDPKKGGKPGQLSATGSGRAISRREFIKTAGGTTAGLGLINAFGSPTSVFAAAPVPPYDEGEIKYGYCRGTIGCMAYCGRQAHVKDGRVVDITGWPEHFISRGHLCAKGVAEVATTYSPHRILHPMKRVGDGFERISWDQAIEEITAILREVRSEWDGKPLHQMTVEEQRRVARTATPRNSSGEQEWLGYMRMGELFISAPHYSGCIGCFGNWWRSALATTGFTYPINTMPDLVNTKLAVNFGANYAETAPVMMQWFEEAKANGMKMICFDPRCSKLATRADEYVPIRPGTDGAVALGILNVLVENGWTYPYMEYYVDKGEWEKYVKEVVSAYTPERVEEVSWVPAEKVRDIARQIREAGRKVSFAWGSRISTSTNGFNTGRIMMTLVLATGAFGTPGGGIHQPKPAGVPCMYIPFAAAAPTKFPDKGYPDDPFSWGKGWVPEAAWPSIKEDIKVGYFLGANGIARAAGDQRGLMKALGESGKLIFATVEWNEMCEYANYILPLATDLETAGSTWLCGSNRNMAWKDAAIDPLGESRSDMWITNEVMARVLGEETFYRACPDCEREAKETLAAGASLDEVYGKLMKPWADEIKRRWDEERVKPWEAGMPTGKDLYTIMNEVAMESAQATGHGDDHRYVIRNIELIFREDLKEWGDEVGLDLDNHGLAWPYNIFLQGPEAINQYLWKLHMKAWPVMPGSMPAMDPDKWHPFSGLRLDILTERPGGVHWPCPAGMMEQDPDYRGETVFFQRSPANWMTSEEMGMPEVPLLWTPGMRWSDEEKNFVPWQMGKAVIDLRGESWHGAGLPEWEEPIYYEEELANKGQAPDLSEEYPFIVITGKMPQFVLSMTKGVNEVLVDVGEEPRVWISTQAAAPLGIADGDRVKIETPLSQEFGPLTMTAKVTELIHPRVIFCPHGTGSVAIRDKLKNEGGINFLANTSEDHLTRMVGYSHSIGKVTRA